MNQIKGIVTFPDPLINKSKIAGMMMVAQYKIEPINTNTQTQIANVSMMFQPFSYFNENPLYLIFK